MKEPDTGTVIGGKYQNELNETTCVLGKRALEPKETNNIADAAVTDHKLTDRNSRVKRLFSAVVANRRHNSRRSSDSSVSRCRAIVQGQLGNFWLWFNL